MTAEEKANIEAGKRHIQEAQMRAHNYMMDKRRASGIHVAEIPDRKEA